MEESKSKKINLPKIILIVSSALLVVVLAVILLAAPKDKPKPAVPPDYVDTAFCDGYDWDEIDKLALAPTEKAEVKAGLLKAVVEASAFSGNPVISSAAPLQEYMSYIDTFYRNEANLMIPIYFSLKLADMEKSGASESAMQGFRLAVMQKLTSSGAIK